MRTGQFDGTSGGSLSRCKGAWTGPFTTLLAVPALAFPAIAAAFVPAFRASLIAPINALPKRVTLFDSKRRTHSTRPQSTRREFVLSTRFTDKVTNSVDHYRTNMAQSPRIYA